MLKIMPIRLVDAPSWPCSGRRPRALDGPLDPGRAVAVDRELGRLNGGVMLARPPL